MKQWLSRMKLAHKMVLGFLGLIALPFTLLSVFSFASVASHYEHQLAQDGQYMLNMVVSDVNEKMDHVEMLMQVLSCNQNLIAFLSHDYNGAVSHEEYTQTVMPLLQGASNAVSPPLERVYLLTKTLPSRRATAQCTIMILFQRVFPPSCWRTEGKPLGIMRR